MCGADRRPGGGGCGSGRSAEPAAAADGAGAPAGAGHHASAAQLFAGGVTGPTAGPAAAAAAAGECGTAVALLARAAGWCAVRLLGRGTLEIPDPRNRRLLAAKRELLNSDAQIFIAGAGGALAAVIVRLSAVPSMTAADRFNGEMKSAEIHCRRRGRRTKL